MSSSAEERKQTTKKRKQAASPQPPTAASKQPQPSLERAASPSGASGRPNKKQRKGKKGGATVKGHVELLGAEEQAAFFLEQAEACKASLLTEQTVTAKHFVVSSSSFAGEGEGSESQQQQRSLSQLAAWLKDICDTEDKALLTTPPRQQQQNGKNNKKKNKNKTQESEVAGAPTVLIITSSAKRACDLFRALGEFNSAVRVGKLFTKHMKLEEQIQFLNSTVVRICVGTPHRVSQLCDASALNLSACRYLVIDMWKNPKQLSLLEMNDVKKDFFDMFTRHFLHLLQSSSSSSSSEQNNHPLRLAFF
ncbi:cms1 ribosomal small subunit [Balamuthia mandrillaris]